MRKIGLIVVDPGHFHAALALKEMYPNVDARVHIYAPPGPDLADFETRIARFNKRADAPTDWRLDVHEGADFLDRMARDKEGDAAIFAGRNHEKIGMIARAIDAGLHVLSDKPMIIRRDQLPVLAAALDAAAAKRLVIQDMMGGQAEITRMLTRTLHADGDIFGEQIAGSAAAPGVEMTSLHHLMKMVSGLPNSRPPWYFDIAQQGDALADIGTHLVDRVHATLFPGRALDHTRDISIGAVKRWPTMMSLAQFREVTGETEWPDYLATALSGNTLAYQCNTHLDYRLRGIHVELDMVWKWLEPPGGGDTHTETWRGTRARIELRHGLAEDYRPQLYVVPLADIRDALKRRMAGLAEIHRGLELEEREGEWRIVIPDTLRLTHDTHFHELTKSFLGRIERGAPLSAEERANLLAKYLVTTAAEAAEGESVR